MFGLELPAFSALTLEWPWAALCLPLPYLVHRLVPAFEQPGAALRVSFFARLTRMLGDAPERQARTRSRIRLGGLGVLWLLCLLAVCRPIELGAPIIKQTSARDLLLAVDLSGSMGAIDLATPQSPQQTRLDVVKQVVGDFVKRRKGDRLGLIVFGDAPFVQVPFTTDTSVVEQLLGETEVAMAGPRTSLGDAVGLSLRLFERSQAKQRVVVLLTDGNDTGSLVPPGRAARIAAEQGITLHVIGVGDPQVAGEESLNENILREMTQVTRGIYSHAQSASELAHAYAELDRLEPIIRQTTSYQPRRSVAYLPLGAMAGLLALAALLFGLGELRPAPTVSKGDASA